MRRWLTLNQSHADNNGSGSIRSVNGPYNFCLATSKDANSKSGDISSSTSACQIFKLRLQSESEKEKKQESVRKCCKRKQRRIQHSLRAIWVREIKEIEPENDSMHSDAATKAAWDQHRQEA
ncbi:hypothetical protein NC651_009762 [Populus alba x Populus x berolinensis]|nr:hypothetical protein NC651_009762 [Populus alba x Populus x berolinensis]